ncbi:MAG TPA: hypothetical protein VH134_13180 [Candidatus Dormibacteraeota bacterium]|nr:hypothetical protein [Candidatus Dormibacteraeota bacterium]
MIAVAGVCVLAGGCGQPGHGTGPAANTVSRPSQPAPLVAVLDAPFGSVPNSLRLVGLDGVEAARLPLPDSAEAVAVGGHRVLVAGGGRLLGGVAGTTVPGALTPLSTLPGGSADSLVRGLVISPDGGSWLFSLVVQHEDGTLTSRIYRGGEGAAPRLLVEHTAPGRALQPVAWTAGGAVVSDEPVGIGGYVLFRRSFGPTSLLDVDSGTLRPLTGEDCAFSDLAADGSVACVVDGREGPNTGGPVRLRIQPRTGAPLEVRLPSTDQQAGAAYFSPDGLWVTLASSPATAGASEPVTDVLVDRRDGSVHPLPASGLIPAGWLPGGHILADRPTGIEGGDPGTWAIIPEAGATRISTAVMALGLLDERPISRSTRAAAPR